MSSKGELADRFSKVRNTTLSLCKPLEEEDFVAQPVEDVSPPKWHLGHTSWFFEKFILEKYKKGYRPYDAFYHYPMYDPATGAARSYLISREKQEVTIAAIPMRASFEAAEPIFTEISQKYSLGEISGFAENAGFSQTENFFDQRNYFVDSLWEKK